MIKWLKWLWVGEGVKVWLGLGIIGIFVAWQAVAWHYGGGIVTLCLDLGLDRLANFLLNHVIIGSLLLVALGLFLLLFSFFKIIAQVVIMATNQPLGSMTDKALYCQHMMHGPKIVAIGGGTGLSNFLAAIKPLTSNITAIVAVTDDGGSSGRLRRDLGILPPGDVRNCLISLSQSNENMERVLAYNFPADSDLAGHNLGNLLMAGIVQSDHTDFASAIQKLSAILALQGSVLPSTVDNVVISGVMKDGRIVSGETKMVDDAAEISRVFLTPADCTPLPEALAAIKEADYIFMGPGSIYTSIITNLLVPKMAETISKSKAKVYYICNIVNQPGEIDKTNAAQYVRIINKHLGNYQGLIHKIIVNNGSFTPEQQEKIADRNWVPVTYNPEQLHDLKLKVVAADLVDEVLPWRHSRLKMQRLLEQELNPGYSKLP